MKRITYLSLITCLLLAVSCKKKPEVVPEEPKETGAGLLEVMTTLILHFKNANDPNDTCNAKFRRLTGSNWQLDSIILKSNSTYNLDIEILDETDLPKVKDVTALIEKKKDFHQFFFEQSPEDMMTITCLNFDSNNKPYGSKSKVEVKGPLDDALLEVSLKHYMNLAEKNGDIKSGATDIYVGYPVRIKK